MSKGGSPMGGGGFGGQQQGFGGGFGGPQGGFGGGFGGQQGGVDSGFGMPQQQQGGFGGGFGGPQGGFGGGFGMPQQQQGYGGGGGYQPSRQRFNQMPQQQMGYGGGFGGQMQGFGMPQQQQGYGGGFGGQMGFPQQQQQAYNQFMQQQRQQSDQTLALNNQLQAAGRPGMLGYSPSQMQPMVSFPAPQQDFGQSQAAAQAAALQSMGMPQSEGGMDAGMGAYNQASAERNMAARAAQANQPPASAQDLASALRGMGGMGGGSQQYAQQAQLDSANAQARAMGLSSAAGMDQQQLDQMRQQLTQQEKMPQPMMPRPMMPPNPYSQQIRQEDPRMQAMRMMQRMRFGGGGGGGYNF